MRKFRSLRVFATYNKCLRWLAEWKRWFHGFMTHSWQAEVAIQ